MSSSALPASPGAGGHLGILAHSTEGAALTASVPRTAAWSPASQAAML